MKPTRTTSLAPLLALALLAGCQQDAASPPNTAKGMQAAIEQATAGVASPTGDAPLQPGQTLQGSIEANVGKGMQTFRSLSTKVADDIAEQMDEKLATGEGRKAINDANRKLEALGTGMTVDAGSVRDIAGGMAGKTFHEAQVRRIDILKTLQVGLSGKAGDGSQLELNLDFDDKTLALSGANLNYRPKASSMFDFYENKHVQVEIERFERNADGSYAIAGTFAAQDSAASPMAKKLDAQTLPSASGRFDYAALPLKEMPKLGR